jgi:hypothetical protein
VTAPMDVDVAELRRACARIAATHDAIVRQAQAVDALQAGVATCGRDYAPAGAGYVDALRGTVVQALQGFAAQVRAVASTLSATVEEYGATEHANTRRLTS